jgi:hypothetical protein
MQEQKQLHKLYPGKQTVNVLIQSYNLLIWTRYSRNTDELNVVVPGRI